MRILQHRTFALQRAGKSFVLKSSESLLVSVYRWLADLDPAPAIPCVAAPA